MFLTGVLVDCRVYGEGVLELCHCVLRRRLSWSRAIRLQEQSHRPPRNGAYAAFAVQVSLVAFDSGRARIRCRPSHPPHR